MSFQDIEELLLRCSIQCSLGGSGKA